MRYRTIGTILGVLMIGTLAHAQITGELVEPNVMLVVDSSGSMDWLSDPIVDDRNQWELAQEACEANDPSKKTSWHQVLDAFLGSIEADYHCTVVPAKLRPAFRGLSQDMCDDIRGYLPDYVSEFRSSFYPHFRAMRCADDNWVLNDNGFYQCIDDVAATVESITASEMTVLPPRPQGSILCYEEDKDETGGVKVCWDFHPLSEPRGSNGILDRFYSSVRFGVMTYDNVPRLLKDDATQHELGWDYGDLRDWECPQVISQGGLCSDWNAGARADQVGAIGGLVRISADLEYANSAVRNVLQSMEPLNCSPVAAILDDVGYYFATDPDVLPYAYTPPKRDPILEARLGADYTGGDRYYKCRPKLAIFLSDGQPTPDFEFPAGSCDDPVDQDVWKPGSTSPAANYHFQCPWRSSLHEAAELYGLTQDIDADATPIYLIVLGFNVPDDIDCTGAVDPLPDECVELEDHYNRCRSEYDGLTHLNPRQFLHEMACQGWQPDALSHPPWVQSDGDTTVYDCNQRGCALFVQDTSELMKNLAMVIESFSSKVVTRTDVVTYNVPYNPAEPEVQQHEFNSGYIAKHGDRTDADSQWQGVLWRNEFACTTGSGNENVDVGAILAVQGDNRELRALTEPDGHDTFVSVLDDEDYPNPQANLGSWITMSPPASTEPYADFKLWDIKTDIGEFTDCDYGVAADLPADAKDLCDNAGVSPVRDETVTYLLNRGLADIFNATPTVLGPPRQQLAHVSYNLYKTDPENFNRRPFLFAGTNDGVLHAFDIRKMTSTSEEVESWGYIPRALLRQTKNQFPIPTIEVNLDHTAYTLPAVSGNDFYQHLFLMDGSPIARDVLLYRNIETLSAATDEKDWWRAVVFGGMGKGARGYYAIDVTDFLQQSTEDDPPDPVLRWEISAADDLWGNNEAPAAADDHPFRHLGYSVSKPALAYIKYKTADFTAEESLVEVAAAVLPGGWDPDPEVSTGVYVVRLADGRLIKYLDPKNSDHICEYSDGITADEHAQLLGEPVLPYGARSLKVAERLFIGDDRGRLWMVDMADEDADEWCLSLYFDTLLSFQYSYDDCGYPSFVSPPTIAEAQEGADRSTVLIFGTGQYDQLSDMTCNRIFSLTDTITTENNLTFHEPRVNWWIGTDFPESGDIQTQMPDSDTWRRLDIYNMMINETHVDFDGYIGATEDFFSVGEKHIGRPIVFDEMVYFTTFIPIDDPSTNGDACQSGRSRIWSVDFNNRNGQNIDTGIDDDDWETMYTANDFGGFRDGVNTAMFIEYPGELLTGVNIVRRPECVTASGDPLFKIVAQKADPGYNPAQPAPGARPIQTIEVPMRKRGGMPKTAVRFDSWTIVF